MIQKVIRYFFALLVFVLGNLHISSGATSRDNVQVEQYAAMVETVNLDVTLNQLYQKYFSYAHTANDSRWFNVGISFEKVENDDDNSSDDLLLVLDTEHSSFLSIPSFYCQSVVTRYRNYIYNKYKSCLYILNQVFRI